MRKKIGIVGIGNMGAAIAERIKADYDVVVFDQDEKKAKGIQGVSVSDNNIDLVIKSDAVILAVKPDDFKALLREIKNNIKDKLIISIAAGITTWYIEKILGETRVVRVMPNLPAKFGQAMSSLCKGRFATKGDLEFVEGLFKKIGKTLIIKENMMGKVTAISGSGPGFLCDLVEGKSLEDIEKFTELTFIPSLTATASALGCTAVQAKVLAGTTGRGTVIYLKKTGLSPEEMKKQVASKKGTTETGLQVLKHNVKNLTAAAKAALKREKELSKK